MARKKIIAGNWKMNMTPSEAVELVNTLKSLVVTEEADVVFCVPAIDIIPVVEAAKGSNIQVGAENMYFEEKGAYTGEISPNMLTDAGVKYVVLGHSERREYFAETNETLMIISISACMAGAVCGDHCSPISDTTIMASAGAQCDHVNHVSTQLPYAMLAAAVSFVTYLVAGFVKTAWIALPVGIVLMVATLMVIRHMHPTLEEHLENETQK